MNIAVIGSGNMGGGLARALVNAGYGVAVASRDPANAERLATELGPKAAAAAHPRAAAANADVVFLAVPFDQAADVARSLGDTADKILVDMSNPLAADYMSLTIGHSTSAAEEIAAAVPEARLVKAFNTILAQVLAKGGDFGDHKAQVLVAGDDEAAKAVVLQIAKAIGFDAMDAGPLKNARYLEPIAEQGIQFAYGLGHGVQIAPVWIKRAA